MNNSFVVHPLLLRRNTVVGVEWHGPTMYLKIGVQSRVVHMVVKSSSVLATLSTEPYLRITTTRETYVLVAYNPELSCIAEIVPLCGVYECLVRPRLASSMFCSLVCI